MILRAGKRKEKSYVIDEIKKDKNGRLVWKDRKVNKLEWENDIQQKY